MKYHTRLSCLAIGWASTKAKAKRFLVYRFSCPEDAHWLLCVFLVASISMFAEYSTNYFHGKTYIKGVEFIMTIEVRYVYIYKRPTTVQVYGKQTVCIGVKSLKKISQVTFWCKPVTLNACQGVLNILYNISIKYFVSNCIILKLSKSNCADHMYTWRIIYHDLIILIP